MWGSLVATAGLAILASMFKGSAAEFNKRISKKGITDPREVWDECVDYHKDLRQELAEKTAKIENAEDLVRVAEGLKSVRAMMEDFDPPVEVKRSIISHWWTELMKLFVPWGLVLPNEIDPEKTKYFRLAGLLDPQRREAELRAMVWALQNKCKHLEQDLDTLYEALDEHGEVECVDPKSREKRWATVKVDPRRVRESMEAYNVMREKEVEELKLSWMAMSGLDKTDKVTEQILGEAIDDFLEDESLEDGDDWPEDTAQAHEAEEKMASETPEEGGVSNEEN